MSREALAAALQSALGGNAVAQGVTQFIDTGYKPLNKIISGRSDGGLPYGRLVEMFGDSSTGKTALATAWMVKAQEMGGVAIFIDWERSFDVDLAVGFGIDTDPSCWVYRRPRTWEEGNSDAAKACAAIRASKAIPATAPILVVFDSIASAIPASMSGKALDELTMNDTSALARVTSTTLKIMAQVADDNNACYLYLNQIRLKIGVVFGDPRTTPGGRAMEYYATTRLALGRQKVMEGTGADKEFVGQKINIQCTKSKLTRAFQDTSIRLMYDDDGIASFDPVYSGVEYLIEQKIIPYSAPKATWEGKTYHVKALVNKIKAEGLESKITDMIQATLTTPEEAVAA